MYDLIIRGGRSVDGTGAPARQADIAVPTASIVAVGEVDGAATEVVDADGLARHAGLRRHRTPTTTARRRGTTALAPSCWHGVTTAVLGNCGVGLRARAARAPRAG